MPSIEVFDPHRRLDWIYVSALFRIKLSLEMIISYLIDNLLAFLMVI